MEVASPRNSSRWQVEELYSRLTENGIPHTAEELSEALSRLGDCGHLVRVQTQPHSVHPLQLVRKDLGPYDRFDALAADVCAVLKQRHERFESEEKLQSWLGEDHVSWTLDELSTALEHLESIGTVTPP